MTGQAADLEQPLHGRARCAQHQAGAGGEALLVHLDEDAQARGVDERHAGDVDDLGRGLGAEALGDVDAVMMLRVQRERMAGGYFPTPREYTVGYGLTRARLHALRPGAAICHPGPMNRGLEISADAADSENVRASAAAGATARARTQVDGAVRRFRRRSTGRGTVHAAPADRAGKRCVSPPRAA